MPDARAIITAFLGYSLVWAQMSYWAVTVITSLITVAPLGNQLLGVVWGAPYIMQPTLSHFIAWHYLLPLALLAIAGVHIVAVHAGGSCQPDGTTAIAKHSFMRWYALKDGVALVPLAWSAGADTLLLPSALMDQELYQAVNTMSTPEHIVPEWYLLPGVRHANVPWMLMMAATDA